jgi:asparagine synthase (glutamine-hydrolysing)
MTFLLAALGPLSGQAWREAVRAQAARLEPLHVHDAGSDDAGVRLAAVAPEDSPAGGPFATGRGGEVIVVAGGLVEGAEPVATSVVRAYLAGGGGAIARLRGEYAFALWDRRERCLWAGCDAVALQAPAYFWDGGTFVLGSRAIGLLRHGAVSSGWDERYIAHALSGLRALPGSGTTHRGVRRMVAGEFLRVSESGVERFPGPRLEYASPSLRDDADALDTLEGRIDRSVRKAARPGACVAVSGGLDSSVIACAMARIEPAIDGFSIMASGGREATDPALDQLCRAVPGLRVHRVPSVSGLVQRYDEWPLPDEPVCTGPALQPARCAMFRAMREQGFRTVVDGEGGDELFDLVWVLGDLVRVGALRSMASAVASPTGRSRLLRDLAHAGLLGPISKARLARTRRRLIEARPWLREGFWTSDAFEQAWDDAVAYARLPNVRARVVEVIGTFARTWRAQNLARAAAGVQGASPFLAREVVEFVGSVHPRIAVNARHSKWLLRKYAARRLPAAVAWRPKSEPLNDRLERECVASDSNVARAIEAIQATPVLLARVDTKALASVVRECRSGARASLNAPIVELFSFVEWAAAVQECARP